MIKIYSISVCIPAYNEENNISILIKSILNQEKKGYKIDEIVVLSDASADNTHQIIKAINHKKIKLFISKSRIGKPQILNSYFSKMHSDLLIQFDADVKLKDKNVIYNLINAYKNNTHIGLISGRIEPLTPKTFAEKIAYFGFTLWEETIKYQISNKSPHYFSGAIRLFSKEFLIKYRFPKNIGTSEDKHCYYYAIKHGFSVVYEKKAVVYFRLPSGILDYINQMKRLLIIPDSMENIFGKKLTSKHANIPLWIKIKTLLKHSLKFPFYIPILFIIIQVIAKQLKNNYIEIPTWKIIESSKKL